MKTTITIEDTEADTVKIGFDFDPPIKNKDDYPETTCSQLTAEIMMLINKLRKK
jgi:hypothetical protein